MQSQKLKESAPSDDDDNNNRAVDVDVEVNVNVDANDQAGEKADDTQHADPDTEKMVNTLRRTDTAPSLASDVLRGKTGAADADAGAQTEFGFFEAFGRMVRINRDAKWLYFWGCVGAGIGGMVFPVFGIIYGEA